MSDNLLEHLNLGIEFAEWSFAKATGLEPFDCRLASYYAAISWRLPLLDLCPLFMFLGPQGSGKSWGLAVFSSVAYRPHVFSGKMSTPALRENMAKARDATLIIDEAGNLSEELLSNRYSRATAISAVMLPTADNSWRQVNRRIFGATILARRVPFRDPALISRSIIIETKVNIEKVSDSYQPIRADRAEKIRSLFEKCKDMPLTETALPPDIQARIGETYLPILSLAETIGDKPFLEEIHVRLRQATENLIKGQTWEPSALVLRALATAQKESGILKLRPVLFKELARILLDEYNTRFNGHQIGQMLRTMGFITGESGGQSQVFSNPSALKARFKDFNISDPLVEGL